MQYDNPHQLMTKIEVDSTKTRVGVVKVAVGERSETPEANKILGKHSLEAHSKQLDFIFHQKNHLAELIEKDANSLNSGSLGYSPKRLSLAVKSYEKVDSRINTRLEKLALFVEKQDKKYEKVKDSPLKDNVLLVRNEQVTYRLKGIRELQENSYPHIAERIGSEYLKDQPKSTANSEIESTKMKEIIIEPKNTTGGEIFLEQIETIDQSLKKENSLKENVIETLGESEGENKKYSVEDLINVNLRIITLLHGITPEEAKDRALAQTLRDLENIEGYSSTSTKGMESPYQDKPSKDKAGVAKEKLDTVYNNSSPDTQRLMFDLDQSRKEYIDDEVILHGFTDKNDFEPLKSSPDGAEALKAIYEHEKAVGNSMPQNLRQAVSNEKTKDRADEKVAPLFSNKSNEKPNKEKEQKGNDNIDKEEKNNDQKEKEPIKAESNIGYNEKKARVRVDELKSRPINGKYNATHIKRINKVIVQDSKDIKGGYYRKEAESQTRNRRVHGTDTHFKMPYQNGTINNATLNTIMSEFGAVNSLAQKNKEEATEKLSNLYSKLEKLGAFEAGNNKTARVYVEQIAENNGFSVDWSKVNSYEKERALTTDRTLEIEPKSSLTSANTNAIVSKTKNSGKSKPITIEGQAKKVSSRSR